MFLFDDLHLFLLCTKTLRLAIFLIFKLFKFLNNLKFQVGILQAKEGIWLQIFFVVLDIICLLLDQDRVDLFCLDCLHNLNFVSWFTCF